MICRAGNLRAKRDHDHTQLFCKTSKSGGFSRATGVQRSPLARWSAQGESTPVTTPSQLLTKKETDKAFLFKTLELGKQELRKLLKQ